MTTTNIFDQVSVEGVKADLQSLIDTNENFHNYIYLDTRGIPTYGYGYALLTTLSSGGWEVNPSLYHDLSLVQSTFSDATIKLADFVPNLGPAWIALNSLASKSGTNYNVINDSTLDNQLISPGTYGLDIQTGSLSSQGSCSSPSVGQLNLL